MSIRRETDDPMKRAATALLLIAGVVACSSDPDNSIDLGTTTTAESPPTDVPTTSPSPTAAPTTVTTVEDTTTTVIETTSTVAETTSTTSVADIEQQVRAAFESLIEARLACGFSPEQCEFEAASLPGSPADTSTRQQVSSDIELGHRSVEGQGDYQWRIDEVRLEESTAFVKTCVFDTLVVFAVGDPAVTSDDAIVNDLRVSKVNEWELHWVQGKWGLFSIANVERYEGEDRCGF